MVDNVVVRNQAGSFRNYLGPRGYQLFNRIQPFDVFNQLMTQISTRGWWCNNHLENYESQWEGWHPINEMENNKKKCLKPPTRQILKHQDYPPFSKRGKRDPPNSMEVYSWEKHGPKRENSYDSRMVMICTVMMLSMAHIWFCKAISIHIPWKTG
jgi:hypothetical protein